MASIAIVGAGIGGLCAARAVVLAGHQPVLIERSQRPPGGAGLVRWPNAVRALDRLDCGQAIRAAATVTRRVLFRSPAGSVLSDLSTAAFERTAGAPLLLIERSELHRLLGAGLAPHRIATVTAADDRGVTLAGGELVRADAVIGADGLHSVVRAGVAPGTRVVDTSYTAIRAIAECELPGDLAIEIWGRNELAGAATLPGGRTYWFYEAPTSRVDPRNPLTALDGTSWPDPLPALASATKSDALLVNTICTVPPVKAWTRGRVTLLGDAAHALAPNLGQGAAQAIEDAAALLTALREHDDLAAALAAYARARRRRAAMIQRQSARMARFALTRHHQARNLLMRMTPDRIRTVAISQLVGR